jgi:hypothetical protein
MVKMPKGVGNLEEAMYLMLKKEILEYLKS